MEPKKGNTLAALLIASVTNAYFGQEIAEVVQQGYELIGHVPSLYEVPLFKAFHNITLTGGILGLAKNTYDRHFAPEEVTINLVGDYASFKQKAAEEHALHTGKEPEKVSAAIDELVEDEIGDRMFKRVYHNSCKDWDEMMQMQDDHRTGLAAEFYHHIFWHNRTRTAKDRADLAGGWTHVAYSSLANGAVANLIGSFLFGPKVGATIGVVATVMAIAKKTEPAYFQAVEVLEKKLSEPKSL